MALLKNTIVQGKLYAENEINSPKVLSDNIIVGNLIDLNKTNSTFANQVLIDNNGTNGSGIPVLKVIRGTNCATNCAYDTVQICSDDGTTLRLAENDGTQLGLCAGDNFGTFVSTGPMRFFTNATKDNRIWNGSTGKLGLSITNGELTSPKIISSNIVTTDGKPFATQNWVETLAKAHSAVSADTLTGFSKISSITWGALKDTQKYTYNTRLDTSGGGSIAFATNDGKLSMQVDGDIFVNEGNEKILSEIEVAKRYGKFIERNVEWDSSKVVNITDFDNIQQDGHYVIVDHNSANKDKYMTLDVLTGTVGGNLAVYQKFFLCSHGIDQYIVIRAFRNNAWGLDAVNIIKPIGLPPFPVPHKDNYLPSATLANRYNGHLYLLQPAYKPDGTMDISKSKAEFIPNDGMPDYNLSPRWLDLTLRAEQAVLTKNDQTIDGHKTFSNGIRIGTWKVSEVNGDLVFTK